jgi:hypothetical protein
VQPFQMRSCMELRISTGVGSFGPLLLKKLFSSILNSLLRGSNYLDTHALGSYNRRPLSLGCPSYGVRLL